VIHKLYIYRFAWCEGPELHSWWWAYASQIKTCKVARIWVLEEPGLPSNPHKLKLIGYSEPKPFWVVGGGELT